MEQSTEKAKRTRTKPDKVYNVNDVKFVYDNYTQMSATQIAEQRGLSRCQVTNIITELRRLNVPIVKKSNKEIVADFVRSLGTRKRSK